MVATILPTTTPLPDTARLFERIVHNFVAAAFIAQQIVPRTELIELPEPSIDRVVCDIAVQQQVEQLRAIAVLLPDRDAEHDRHAARLLANSFACVGLAMIASIL